MDTQNLSRRDVIRAGLVTGLTGMMGFALVGCNASATAAVTPGASPSPDSTADKQNDIMLLNAAIGLEDQAIWAYTTAAATNKLAGDDAVTTAVRNLALRNMADHEEHRKALAGAVTALGGTPTAKKDSYMDGVKAYIDRGEGNLDSLANIAKLALALEYDAALAYVDTLPKIKTNSILAAGVTILPDESAHAAAIRALLAQAGVTVNNIVASPFITAGNRDAWIIKV